MTSKPKRLSDCSPEEAHKHQVLIAGASLHMATFIELVPKAHQANAVGACFTAIGEIIRHSFGDQALLDTLDQAIKGQRENMSNTAEEDLDPEFNVKDLMSK